MVHHFFALRIIPVLLVLSVASIGFAGFRQDQTAPPSSTRLSEKALFKQADQAYAEGRLDEARTLLMAAFHKRTRPGQKPKPHEKYTPMLAEVNQSLADQEAVRGEQSLNADDLPRCQKHVEAAKLFSVTPRVSALQTVLSNKQAEVSGLYQKALRLSEAGQHDESLNQLNALLPFEGYLTELQRDLIRVRGLLLEQLLEQSHAMIAERRWTNSWNLLKRAERLDEENKQVKSGLQRVETGRQADELRLSAESRLSDGAYAEALEKIVAASRMDPGAKAYSEVREQIKRKWVESLLPSLPKFFQEPGNFRQTRDGVLCLEKIRDLDAYHSVLLGYDKASQNFGANCLERALALETSEELSRIGTAYVLKMNAQLRLPSGMVPLEELKSTAVTFNRKRASQLLISVENLVGAPASFTDTIRIRSINEVENMALPDLRIRTLEQYRASPDEDPELQDLRPAGNSATALLTAELSRYESERWAEPPEEMKSQYQSGDDLLPNPEYGAKAEEIEAIRRTLVDPKANDKMKREADYLYQLRIAELGKIEKTIRRPRLVDYAYQKIKYRQHTALELTITLRDLFTREMIAREFVSFVKDGEGDEISGVRESDVSGVRNLPVRLAAPEQVLREAERSCLESLDTKIKNLLPQFTQRFFKEGQKMLELGKVEDAIEQFICHWAFFRGRLESPQEEFIADTVRREIGFDLRKNGQELLSLVARVAPVST